jgi:MFS family permease
MTISLTAVPADDGSTLSPEHRKVLAATLIGTSIEWYDYFIYAQAAGMVFGPLFFGPIAKSNAALSQIIAFATIGVAFLFRPLGAVVGGWLGDRFGRRISLVLTLVLMGGSTALIGMLPTYAQAGLWAPLLLIVLRIVQGFSAGGEWGGAALMAVEHAPPHKRSLFGSFPQIGTPLGMILATLVLLLFTALLTPDEFLAWGWRVPFLLSIALVGIGLVIRRTVEESPIFLELQRHRQQASAPLAYLLRHHYRQVVQAALIFMANNAAGYLLIAFFISYGQKTLHLPATTMLMVCTAASVSWLLFTLLGGMLGDRLGRVQTFQIGYVALAAWAVPMWWLIDSAAPMAFFVAAAVMAATLGLSYGPQAALYAEMFPAKVRYSGVSLGYALGSILGGAFAATIAQWIISTLARSWLIGAYIAVLSMISLIAVSIGRNSSGVTVAQSKPDES